MVGVEAAIVSAAMSGTLKIVGDKLAPLLLKEYTSIMGVEDDLKGLYDLVKEIIEWLETTGDKASWNYPSFTWLNKLKDVSYDADDLVDEFHLEAEKHEANGDSGRHSVSKFLCTKPKSFMFRCKAARKLKAIKKRFAAIVKQRTEFSAIANSVPVRHPVHHIDKTTEEMASLPNVDEASVFGRYQDKGHIISKLVEASDDRQKINIVSIIGLGGSGKTTLAKLVFNDGNVIKSHFEVRLWVHVSQEFNVQKLIHKLFEAFSSDKSERHPLQHMTNEITEKLSRKRFLLVMDDVWTDSRIQWEDFMVHLKSDTPGSRILLTARSSRVAETVGSTDIFDLPFLSEDDSWQLFQQSLITPAKLLEFGFAEAGKELVKKCGGVPLAIKVLAGALRDKEMVQEWHAMRGSNLLDVEGEESIVSVSACLKLSYFHLPSHLKQCFTICSVFPKGYEIDKDQLIDLWIAHDMITPVDEHNGSKFFNYLVQIYFLQDVYEYGGRMTCKMHDLVHDLARSILGDEISCGVPKEAVSSTKNYRYFCLTEKLGNLPPEYFEKARSLFVGLEGLDFISDKTLKNAKHLRSITVESYYPGEVLAAILQSKNLKYLEISRLSSEALLKVISNIWTLQALHIRSSSLDKLPDSIGKLQRLRTFNLSYNSKLESLPDSIGKLQKLRTLNLFGCFRLQSLSDSIGDCHMISSINLSGCSSLKVLPNSFGKLRELKALDLSDCVELESLPDSIGDCRMISSINLFCCHSLKVLPNSFGKLQELRALDLSECIELESLPGSIGDCRMISSINLSNCSSLKVLPNSFRKLQELRALDLSGCTKLESLPDSIGDCRMISSINLDCCRSLKVLPNSFGKLQELRVLDLSGCLELESLPDSIGDCRVISSINISCCPSLKVLPKSFGKLQELKALDLSNCFELESLPNSTVDCRMISSINVSCCRGVKVLPNSFDKLQELRALDLSGCLALESLPDSIGDCRMISSINLSRCHSLKVLPSSFGKLQELRALDLSGCIKLESLPDSIGDCCMISSINLDCCHSLKVLPNSFGKLQELRALDLPSCFELESLPDSIGDCRMISSINLDCCRSLKVLPNSFGKLQELSALDLSCCLELQSVPDSIGDCCMISSIDVSCCHSLKVLPNSFGKLQELRTLDLSCCYGLESLPDSIGDCRMISSIDISCCHNLKVLPNSFGKLQELRTLDLSWCYKLESIPDSIGGNKNLRGLNLGHTEVERLPSIITTLGHLECLDLEWCDKLVELPEGIGNLEKLKVLNLEHCECLRAMPIGIGQLTQVQKLGLFVVGEGEKSARILELANISRISKDLTIRGIACVMHPDDAHKACLKQKANLKRLKLEWGRNGREEVHAEMEQAVLDGLEPPSGIEKLCIREYAGGQFARWMLKQVGCVKQELPPESFPCLTKMKLSDLPNLKHLEGLVEMPSLKDLCLIDMPALQSISGGPFPSLVKLVMDRLDSLREVWMVTERTLAVEEAGGGGINHSPHHLARVHIGSRLTDITIIGCDNLMVKPYFPSSLQRLKLNWSNEQLLELPQQDQGSSYSSSLPPSFSFSHLKELELCWLRGLPSGRGWELLLHMTALESLVIDGGMGLTELPESMRSLASLKSLTIIWSTDLAMLPEWLGELRSLEVMTIDNWHKLGSLPQSVGNLASSLRVLRISSCYSLHQLPECLGELSSLREFYIDYLPGLTCLPQSMCHLTSLEKLTISRCQGLTSLPEGIQGLSSLRELKISSCPAITSLPGLVWINPFPSNTCGLECEK
ncbi:hypothetical protein ACP70R_021638 [Stipagrostis hirtigluma subsp. patula]